MDNIAANANSSKKSINWKIFLPPWLILVAIVVLSFVNYDAFNATLGAR